MGDRMSSRPLSAPWSNASVVALPFKDCLTVVGHRAMPREPTRAGAQAEPSLVP